MLDDIRNQLNLTRTNHEADISRLESRLLVKIDESQRNTEKYVSKHFSTKNKRISFKFNQSNKQ
jgi:hypothetical protein